MCKELCLVLPFSKAFFPAEFKIMVKDISHINPLTPKLNPSSQRCLTRFSSGDFVS
jgi:hypothetical protein